jgi:hypothetical protein
MLRLPTTSHKPNNHKVIHNAIANGAATIMMSSLT